MTINIDYLIPQLRLRIGDTTESTYRYLDEWLKIALIASVRVLQRYWKSKYLIADSGVVTRNLLITTFEFTEEESGVIQEKDEDIIILKAAIIILEGSLENSAWDFGSWKDNEIAVSSIESGRVRGEILSRLQAELDSLIKPPTKQLAQGYRQSILEEFT